MGRLKFFIRVKPLISAVLPLVLLISTQAQTGELSRDDRWREDILFYAQELPKRHKNLFFQLPKDEFEREVKNLAARIAKLSDDEIALELMRITARIGDGHTQSRMPAAGWTFFPLRLERFAEGWFVTQTPDEYRQALGARLVQLGDTKIERVGQLMRNFVAADNDLDRESRMSLYFVWAEVLQAKGILKSKESGTFVFIDRDARRLSLEVRTVSGPESLRRLQWRGLSEVARSPLSAKSAQRSYWFEYLPGARTLYLAYNRCENDSERPFDNFVKELFAVVDERPTERFVVDMRRNSGGNSAIIKSLYSELEKRPRLIEKGKLFVLVSNATFSSAFLNAVQMRDRLNAVWVGAPPGQRPNNYGEVRRFQLPHSKIEVQYSTKFYELLKNSNLSFVPVDVPVESAFADYREGRDTVLEAALSYRIK